MIPLNSPEALSPPAPAAAPESKALNFKVRGFLFVLRETQGVLTLAAPHLAGYGAISADWASADVQRRIRAGRKQLLAKALGLHRQPQPHLLDATAGLGRDGYTLAALGATVSLVERNPALAHLLRDAHRRATADQTMCGIAERITVIEADAAAFLTASAEAGLRWDAVLLDPMYPEDGKTALPAKEMQLIRDLTGGDADADALLDLALACARQRVAVKRPAKGGWLAGRKPALQLKGTQARFDIYLPS